MIKKFKKYVKTKKNKTPIIIIGLLALVNLGVSGYFIFLLSLLNNIENILRMIGMGLLGIIAIAFVFKGMKVLLKGKVKSYLVYILVIILSISIQSILSYVIITVYNPINNINKSQITYTTDLIILSNSKIEKISDLKNKKIGLISKDKSEEDYTLGKQIIKENKLEDNNKIVEYDDYFEMINDLYEEELAAILVSDNYSIMFSSFEKFENIRNEVKAITSKSGTFKKHDTVVNKKVSEEPFTVLLMGVDSEKEGLDKNAAFNGDSLMLITFNPKTLNATMLSIPRDTYVPIACFANQKKNKITHASWSGADCMINTIENFTKIDIDYYVKMNFKGVVSLVDALGGIDIDVPIKFCEQNSDRLFGKNQICLNTGYQHLNGEQALALARHRKTLALGDIQRGINQQLVVEGMVAQLSNLTSLDKFNNVLNSISDNMDTNLTTDQILSFYNVGKDILSRSKKGQPILNLEKLYLNGHTKMIYDNSFKMNLSNYVYYEDSLKDVVNAMNTNLGKQEATLIKEFSFDINETYEKAIIGKDSTGKTSNTDNQVATFPNLIGKSKNYVSNYCKNHNIKASFVYVRKGDKLYSDNYDDGEVVSQSVSAKTPISKISSVTFSVIVKEETNNNTNNNSNNSNTNNNSNSNNNNKPEAETLPNLKGYTLSQLDSWYNSIKSKYKITLTKQEIIPTDPLYDSTKNTNVVLTVNHSKGTKLDNISSITITYQKPQDPTGDITDPTDPIDDNDEETE